MKTSSARDRGIIIEDLWAKRAERVGRRWLYRVRDPAARKYISRAFEEGQEAIASRWAQETKARVTLGLESAGTLTIQSVGAEYLTRLQDRDPPPRPAVLKRLQKTIDELTAAGVTDLKARGFRGSVEHYLRNVPVTHTWGSTGRPAISTKHMRLKAIRSFINLALRRSYLRVNPLADLNPFTIPDSPREVFTLDELRRIAELRRTDAPEWLWAMLMIYTGLRSAESLALRWEDIDWKARIIRVRIGKGRKSRTVTMMTELYQLLMPLGGPEATMPRIGRVITLEHIHSKDAWYDFRRFLRLVDMKAFRRIDAITGIPVNLSPHSCRHTFASLKLATGEDSLYLRLMLGHGDEELTEHYAQQVTQYAHQVETEGWERGQFYLMRPPPIPMAAAR